MSLGSAVQQTFRRRPCRGADTRTVTFQAGGKALPSGLRNQGRCPGLLTLGVTRASPCLAKPRRSRGHAGQSPAPLLDHIPGAGKCGVSSQMTLHPLPGPVCFWPGGWITAIRTPCPKERGERAWMWPQLRRVGCARVGPLSAQDRAGQEKGVCARRVCAWRVPKRRSFSVAVLLDCDVRGSDKSGVGLHLGMLSVWEREVGEGGKEGGNGEREGEDEREPASPCAGAAPPEPDGGGAGGRGPSSRCCGCVPAVCDRQVSPRL